MDPMNITQALNQQEWLGPVAEGLQTAVQKVYAPSGEAGQAVADALHGVRLGHPLHPVLTDIPLGAWTTAAALDLMQSLGRRDDLAPGADAAVGVGLLGALGAAATGLTDWYFLKNKNQQRTGAAHALLNVTATALYGASWLLRKRGARSAGRTAGWLGYAVVAVGAYLGGTLVYEERVGVDHAPRQGLPPDFVPVLDEGELAENQPKKVEANGVPVVLVRQGAQIFALAEACSHLGGPLAEGRVESGCIVCPWHGSRFGLADGRVMAGPATFPQPRFDVRVREGQIEVRAPAVPQNKG